MNNYIVEIKPKNSALDPLARHVQAGLIESGQNPLDSVVETRRLFRIQGKINSTQIKEIAQELLLDPVVEEARIHTEEDKKTKGIVVDVWPKKGVTDPVGETVKKGLHDMGFRESSLQTASATRYVFPKLKNIDAIKNFTVRTLANTLIHDIDIRENT